MSHSECCPPELMDFNNLRLSLAEEAQAIYDYKCRALSSTDKNLSKMYMHLAGEEAQHFAMLLEQLVDSCPLLEDRLMVKCLSN